MTPLIASLPLTSSRSMAVCAPSSSCGGWKALERMSVALERRSVRSESIGINRNQSEVGFR